MIEIHWGRFGKGWGGRIIIQNRRQRVVLLNEKKVWGAHFRYMHINDRRGEENRKLWVQRNL